MSTTPNHRHAEGANAHAGYRGAQGDLFDLQRYLAEQQYYVYLYCVGITASWQQYVKNYAPNLSFDYGNRAAALWLER